MPITLAGAAGDDDGEELTPEQRERLDSVAAAAAEALGKINLDLGKSFSRTVAELAQQSLAAAGWQSQVERLAAQISSAFAPDISKMFSTFAAQAADAAALQQLAVPGFDWPKVTVTKDLTLSWNVEASIEDAEDLVEEVVADEIDAPLDVLLLAIYVLSLVAAAAGIALTDDPGGKAMNFSGYLLIVAMLHQERRRREG